MQHMLHYYRTGFPDCILLQKRMMQFFSRLRASLRSWQRMLPNHENRYHMNFTIFQHGTQTGADSYHTVPFL